MSIDLSSLTYKFAGTKSKALEIRTPKGSEDVRANRDEITPPVALHKSGSTYYFLMPDVQAKLPDKEVQFVRLQLACVVPVPTEGESDSAEKSFILWLIKQDTPSASEAAEAASKKWCRVKWEMKNKRYEVSAASKDNGEIDWPFDSIDEAVNAAFRGRIIDSLDHAVIRKILGSSQP